MNRILSSALCAVVLGTAGCCMFSGSKEASCAGEAPAPAIDGVVASETQAAQVAVHPDSRNWSPLFNFALSNADFERGVWYIDERGRLTADKDEAIWSKREYENFVLDLEYACAPAANSGVLIYATDTKNWIPNTIEIQIQDDLNSHWDKVDDTWRNGGLFGHCAPKVRNVRAAGEWNRMTITAIGQKIKVAVNGEITVDADLADWKSATTNPDGSAIPSWLNKPWAEMPTRGKIGLQGKHGQATIYFRSIKIKEL
ncbi:MAG: DUF1080 domain-containing protein [Kiritimatiellae bacterium]|nr:DUF1080 domain-containing protein [Kiritimatiellia bacterium]